MRIRGLIFIAFVAAVIAGGFWYWITLQKRPGTIYQSKFIARNILFPDLAPDHRTVRFFTGTAFANLSLDSGKSTSITREYQLPPVKKVRWGKTGALINVSIVTGQNELFPRQTTNASVWWLVDFVSGNLKPLAVGNRPIEDAIWQTDSNQILVSYDNGSGGHQISLLDANLSHETKLTEFGGHPDRLSLVTNYNGRVIVHYQKGIVDTSSRQTLGQTDGPLYYNSAKQTLVYLSVDKQIKLFDLSSSKTKTVPSPNGNLSLAVSDGGIVAVGLQGNNFDSEVINWNGQAQNIDVIVSTDKLDQLSSLQVIDNNHRSLKLLAFSASGDMVMLTSNQTEAYKYGGTKLVLFDNQYVQLANGNSLVYDLVNNTAAIFIPVGADFQTQQKAIMQELSSRGIDPNQLNKAWVQGPPQGAE